MNLKAETRFGIFQNHCEDGLLVKSVNPQDGGTSKWKQRRVITGATETKVVEQSASEKAPSKVRSANALSAYVWGRTL